MSDAEQTAGQGGDNGPQIAAEQPLAIAKGGKRKRRDARLRNQPASVEAMDSTKQPPTGIEEADNVPKTVSLFDFADARVHELQSMMKAVKASTGVRLASQALPRHMRRRAVSHNCKRLPVRLRAAALRGGDKQHKGEKGTCRRERRKPSNLRSTFAQRKRRVGWLETHLWHAKRMHMKEMWGYRLAQSPCDKGRRAAFRASARGCLMVDTSYYTCVELSGSLESICQAMDPLTHVNCGPTVKAAQYLSGRQEGSVSLFMRGAYPHGVLGPARFLWKARDNLEIPPPAKRSRGSAGTTDSCHLWLWLHPSYFKCAFEELTAVCSEFNVSVSSLREELCRFSIFGPVSTPLLKNVLDCCRSSSLPVCSDASVCEWWSESSDWEEVADDNRSTWHEYAAYPPRTVIGLVVRDPRLGLPDKRKRAASVMAILPDNTTPREILIQDLPGSLCSTPLWSSSVRNQVRSTKLTEQQFNKRRAAVREAPEEVSDDQLSTSLVPILLCRHSQGPGWDLILPSGWAMAFWVSLVYHGAHPAGLEEVRQRSLEAGQPFFPHDSVDSPPGIEHARCQELEAERKYLMRPPQKRLAYPQLAVVHPFSLAWKELLTFSGSDTTGCDTTGCDTTGCDTTGCGFYILRNVRLLRQLERLVLLFGGRGLSQRSPGTSFDQQLSAFKEAAVSDGCSLIPVYLETTGRGVFRRGATISLPSTGDLKGSVTLHTAGPVQPKLSAKLSKDVPCISDETKTVACASEQPSRATIGFVMNGVHSLGCGKGIATGFCSLQSIVSWLILLHENHVSRPLVLLRNHSSYQYRFSELKVLVNTAV